MPTDARLTLLLICLTVVGLLAALIIAWQVLGRGPRRSRGLRRVRRHLRQGHWAKGLEWLRQLRKLGRPSLRWQKRFDEAEADCLKACMDQALANKNFEEALETALRMVHLREKPDMEARALIQGAMLEEMRRLFATGSDSGVHDLAIRILLVQSPCREASFWQGLAYLREGQTEQAIISLQTARTGAARTLWIGEGFESSGPSMGFFAGRDGTTTLSTLVDPALYLGALLLRQSQPKEALRFFTEANRLDGNCPIVTLLLGSAMIAGGGDSGLAVRALQRALGPRGMAQWKDKPARVWVEGFAEQRSYIRKLAVKHPYVCPLWDSDLALLVRQGELALAQGLYRLGQFQESCDLFTKCLHEGAPSWGVLRGLGLALARLGKYDDAFKHLRTAHEMEEPKDRITAGYLALCGAMGKPSRPEDKAQNMTWAIGLVTRFNAPHDAEWTNLISSLFAEGRDCKVPQSLDDQLYLCEHLCAVHATDAQAAQAFLHLQATYPQSLRPDYAWLFCRAAQQHGVTGAGALELFALTFAHDAEARAFFTEKGWDFSEMEFTYLARSAELAPGSFPANLGPDYPARGEQLLLERSRKQEQSEIAVALVSAETLVKLAPRSAAALDRLAYLHHRLGQSDQAVEFLRRWQEFHPHDPVPLVRQAVFLYQGNQIAEGQERIRRALQLAAGKQRADLAFFGTRLALQSGRMATVPGGSPLPEVALETAHEFLQVCVLSNPDHGEGLECLAAVRWLRGDMAALAAQADQMDRAEIADPRFHFAAGLCHLAGQNHARVLEACQRATAVLQAKISEGQERNGALAPALELDLGLESSYLAGIAYLNLLDLGQASAALRPVALAPGSPSVSLAQAMLGASCFAEQKHEDAARWWQMVDAKKRAGWKLNDPLATTVFITAVESLEAGRFEEAAEKFRSAGRLGNRDRQLGPLLVMALFRAGQQAFYHETPQTSG